MTQNPLSADRHNADSQLHQAKDSSNQPSNHRVLAVRELKSDEFLPAVEPWLQRAGMLLVGGSAAAIALLSVWPYRAVIRGSGAIRPQGETSVIQAPFRTVVREIMIKPNQRVTKDQLLVELDSADLKAKQQKLEKIRRSLVLRSRALNTQAKASSQSAGHEVSIATAQLQLAAAELDRFQVLQGTGTIAATQLDEKFARFKTAQASLLKARENAVEQRSRTKQEKASLEQELVINRSELDQVSREIRNHKIVAPSDGIIFSVNLRNPGQVLNLGDELARMVPSKASLFAKVTIPAEAITNVQKGQTATLKISGCPYPDFGTLPAEVVSIAPESNQTESQANGASLSRANPIDSGSSSGYEVTMGLGSTSLQSTSRTCALKIGMNLEAAITARRETVLQFLLRKARLTTNL